MFFVLGKMYMPPLQHLAPLCQVLGAVVGGAGFVLVYVGQCGSDDAASKAGFVQGGGCQGAQAIGGVGGCTRLVWQLRCAILLA